MTIEEAREYWSRRLEHAEAFSDEYMSAYMSEKERRIQADYIDALKHAVTALAIYREHEEAAKKPKTVRHGRWLSLEGWFNKSSVKCSVCGNTLNMGGVNAGRGDANFCPNCGARMDGGDNNAAD